MDSNTFGRIFRVTTFGESHGAAIGCVIDGCPAGLAISTADIQKQLDRRRPGQSAISSPRQEKDQVQILSGVFEGKTLGTPITLLIPNEDARNQDYDNLAKAFRPSHGDFTWQEKFGHRDYRGGGRSSARETAARVAAGAVAMALLNTQGVTLAAWVSQVGPVKLGKDWSQLDLTQIESNAVRCPDVDTARQMEVAIEQARDAGDSLGGAITLVAQHVPIGWGEPVFDKLHARLGYAMLGINAVKGFELGAGFEAAAASGSALNDQWDVDASAGQTLTNNSGGVQGGISNGMPILCRVAFKPVATIMQPQNLLTPEGTLEAQPLKGRHDPCVVPRAVAIVEAMAALVLADFMLLARGNRV